GSVNDLVGQSLVINSRGHAAMINYFAQKGVRGPRGIFVYDGVNYTKVAMRNDAAPGMSNKIFDQFSQLRINNNDQVAFTVNFEPLAVGGAGLYIGSPGGMPVKVAATGETAPATGGTYSSLNIIGFNDSGKLAFWADIAGSSTSRAVFITTATGVTKIVASGESAPETDSYSKFNLQGAENYYLNSNDEIAFLSNVYPTDSNKSPFGRGIWVYNPVFGVQKLVTNADNIISLPGQYGGSITLRGFNSSGQVLFSSYPTSPSSPYPPGHALFLMQLSYAPDVVFAMGAAVPGRRTEQYNSTAAAVLNEAGDVAFEASLQNGSIPYGWFFFGHNASAPIMVVLEGQRTPAGGAYGLALEAGMGRMNASGRLAFVADLLGPNEVGAFLWTPPTPTQGAVTSTIVTTADSLPAGASTVVRTFAPGASDDMLVFCANKAGGRMTTFARPLSPAKEEYIPIVTEGDAVPGGNGRFWYTGGSFFLINDHEEIAIYSYVLGPMYPAWSIYTWKPGSGLSEVVTSGDLAPGTGEGRFGSISQTNSPPMRINSRGQIAFQASMQASPPAVGPGGVFIGSATSEPKAIARFGDASPLGGTFTSFSANLALNDNGDVVFRAVTQVAPNNQPPGIFVGNGNAVPAKVAALNDIFGSYGTVNSVPNVFLMNNQGQVAYVVSLSAVSTPRAIFVGTAGGSQSLVACVGQSVPGISGGVFSQLRDADIELNNRGDVAFWAQFTLGSASLTGQFLRFANGQLVPRIIAGQALPGGGHVGSVGPGLNGLPYENVTLTESGEMRVFAWYVTGTQELYCQVIASPTGELRRMITAGEMIPGIGGGYLASIFQMATANSLGQYFDTGMIAEGQAKWAILWTANGRKK
ncbi:MAG: choice-of-anchor tandem repeat NxxGxxAF-containing protein, partial [Acidobacteriota bacterium]